MLPMLRLARINNMAAPLRVLVALLAVVSISLIRRTAATVTVEEACQQNTKVDAALCVKSLSAANPALKAAALERGLPGLAELSLSQTAQFAEETVTFLKGLSNMPGGMPPECLKDCVGKFQEAVAELQRSKAAQEQGKDMAGVKASLSAAKTHGETCMHDCTRIEGGGELQIVDKIGDLSKMCSIALSLTDASVGTRAA
ncbi:hypothetical protein BS78_01G021200 [Paspalum vaginatum]|nr:hypothetical protein BS78_01G021200 [Paspalum vaginatum]